MTKWSELDSRQRPPGLPLATQRQIAPGRVRYTFVHDDLELDDPSLDPAGRYFVSPRDYGFAIRGFKEGRTAWARDFANGTMLVVNAEGLSHVLSPKVPARVLFVAPDGVVLQDSGAARVAEHRMPDLATVRLTINVTFDLHGESPEAARALLMRMVDQAIFAGPPAAQSDATIVNHAYEMSTVLTEEPSGSTETNFSQLLDL